MILRDFLDKQKNYFKCYIPVTLDLFLGLLSEFMSVVYAAKIGPDYYVTGVGIAGQVNLCTMFSIMYGYSTMFECYAGSLLVVQGKSALGVLLIKCALQGCCLFAVLLGPYYCTTFLVQLFGEDEQIQEVAVLYIKLLSLRPLFVYFRELLMRYLVSLDFIFVSLAIAVFACLPAFFLMCWLTVEVWGWGLYGLALSQTGLSILYVVLQIAFCIWKRVELDFPTLQIKVLFHGWAEMMKLGIFSSLRMLSSWAIVGVTVVICQVSGPETAAAVIILDRVQQVLNASVYGGAYATAILLGTAMGEQSKTQVKDAMKVGVLNLFLDRLFIIGLYIAVIGPTTRALTDDPEVAAEVREAVPVLIVTLILLSSDEMLSRGILTPFAKQRIIGIVTPVSMFLVALPVLLYLVFVYRVDAKVYFLCISLGNLIQCIVYIVRVALLDIEEEMRDCLERQNICDTSSSYEQYELECVQ